MNTKTTDKTKKRLDYLSGMLGKYAHRWNDAPSRRMEVWVDEYNRIIEENPETFKAYCVERGLSTEHDGYDCLA